MPLPPGTRLGPYEILAPIGAGGMGEVYRALDTKLDRETAIKILPETLTHDPERLARFEREAKVLASLNHPNIAQIYAVEQAALVMELVPGQALAGPLPLETALTYAQQIADALAAAHEKGITHRDLKPANIMVTPAGVVKLLDFGLAKASDDATGAGDPTNSPTLTMSSTRAGMIMGTAAYMAPEQARGKPVDRRADVWAFGCVLYEMLTGRPTFSGETVSDILAAVLTEAPELTAVPAKVRRLIAGCLEKDPRKRLQAIGDWRLLLIEEPRTELISARKRWPSVALAGTLSLALIAVSVFAYRVTRPTQHRLIRFNVDLGPDAMAGVNTTLAISPDGNRIVFPSHGAGGKQQLATRLLDQAQATQLPGTENGIDPFFSPDGQWVGFFANSQLKKTQVQGNSRPVTLCAAPRPQGGTWGEDGYIIAALSNLDPLMRISADGGTPEPFTKLQKGEATHRWPQVLPGGRAVIFTAAATTIASEGNVEVLSLKTRERKTLVRGGYYGRYLPDGHLVYLRQGVLFGVPFDIGHLELRGAPTPLIDDVAANPIEGGGQFDFSARGTLAYLAGKSASAGWPIMWLDSSGKMQPLVRNPGIYNYPRFSPDGQRLAMRAGNDIVVYDIRRETMTPVTFTGQAIVPVWAPDGKHIAFRSITPVGYGLSWVRADGGGEPQLLLINTNNVVPFSFSPDGKRLAYHEVNPDTGNDIWTLPLDLSDPDHPKPGKPELFLRTPASEMVPAFSPDGHWIAYRSDASGTDEIYVQPFPPAGGKWRISSGGGLYGAWSQHGHELFYETLDGYIMVLDYVTEGASFVPGKARLWSDKQLFFAGTMNLGLHPDGKRFAVFPMPEAGGQKNSVQVTFLLNFFDDVRRRVPVGR